MQVQAISLDLDDTLWDIWATIARAEQQLHHWLDQHYPAISAAFTALELRQLAHSIAKQQPGLTHDRSVLRKTALKQAAEQVNVLDFCEHTAFEIFYSGRNQVLFFEDALETLGWLSARYPLIALTNGNADLAVIGIDQHFKTVLTSAQLGISKPDPRIFAAACNYLQLQPEQICHIGDDPELDIQGAAQAGLRTIWLNRQGQAYPETLVPPDISITRLAELPKVLNQARSAP